MSALNFGAALDAMNRGHRVRRAGWNGKGMWLVLVKAQDYSVGKPGAPVGPGLMTASYIESFDLLPWIGMKTADNKFVPWLASQTDLLADDYETVEAPE